MKSLPGANQDGSREAATSSGCAGLREKHSCPPAGQGCPGIAGTIVVAGPRPSLGPGFPRPVLPARMGHRVKEHQETLQESRVLEEARRSLLGANSAQSRPKGQGRPLFPQSPDEPSRRQPTLPQLPGPALGPGSLLCLSDLACTWSLVGAGCLGCQAQGRACPGCMPSVQGCQTLREGHREQQRSWPRPPKKGHMWFLHCTVPEVCAISTHRCVN